VADIASLNPKTKATICRSARTWSNKSLSILSCSNHRATKHATKTIMFVYLNSLLEQLLDPSADQLALFFEETASRILADEDNSNSHRSASSTSSSSSMGNDRFEFIAFLLWYIFLVFCCVVPTCCAYRRRRRAELRLATQQANLNRLQHSNLFILSNLQRHSQNTERIQLERKRLLTEELKATTMVRVGATAREIYCSIEIYFVDHFVLTFCFVLLLRQFPMKT